LIQTAIDNAVQKSLLNPTQAQSLLNTFLKNLKNENALNKAFGISLVESIATDAFGAALETEMRLAGYSEYLTQPTVFVAKLALSDGFEALSPDSGKYGGPEGAVVVASIQQTAGELIRVAQQGFGLGKDIQLLKQNFVTLKANVDQLYALAKKQQDLGNPKESNRLLKLASSTQTTIQNLRSEYTVAGVSILDGPGWDFLSVFVH
jgi:hypothetical protein